MSSVASASAGWPGVVKYGWAGAALLWLGSSCFAPEAGWLEAGEVRAGGGGGRKVGSNGRGCCGELAGPGWVEAAVAGGLGATLEDGAAASAG